MLHFSHVSFKFDCSAEPLFTDLNIQFSPGWHGIVGANGVGKTTLLRRLLPLLNLPPDEVLYLPQEISAESRRQLAERLRRLSPAEYTHVMRVVASLGSDPADHPRRADQPSRSAVDPLPRGGALRNFLRIAAGQPRPPFS